MLRVAPRKAIMKLGLKCKTAGAVVWAARDGYALWVDTAKCVLGRLFEVDVKGELGGRGR